MRRSIASIRSSIKKLRFIRTAVRKATHKQLDTLLDGDPGLKTAFEEAKKGLNISYEDWEAEMIRRESLEKTTEEYSNGR
jgi:hypothetical protein